MLVQRSSSNIASDGLIELFKQSYLMCFAPYFAVALKKLRTGVVCHMRSLSDMRVLKLDMFFYTLYLNLSVVAKYAPACPKALFELSAYQRTLGQ